MQSERRRAQVHDHIGALIDQASGRLTIVKRAGEIMFRPNILANGDADFLPIEIERLDTVRRLEIAVLVENVVGRQE